MGEETKFVCADCFVNQECKQLISQNGKIGNCSYCCQGNKKVMEIDDFVTEWYFAVSDRLEPIEKRKLQMAFPTEPFDPQNTRGLYLPNDLNRKNKAKQIVNVLTENKILKKDIMNSLMRNKQGE